MTERTCHNCVYSCCDPCRWLRAMWAGQPILPSCANHPQWPGRLRDVPGVPCRNYRPRPPIPEGDVRMIPLGDGNYAYVDAADYEWLNQWNWHLDHGYAARYDKSKRILMHRLIMQPPEAMVVHHRDDSRTNNCRCNLCVCTPQENTRNKRRSSNSSSIFKGVTYCKEKRKWSAMCTYNGKAHRLGCFDVEVDAARTYDRAAAEWFGEFARLNFPPATQGVQSEISLPSSQLAATKCSRTPR